MKRRFIAGILVIALGLTGCGSTETKEITTVSAANTAATFEMITTTETYTDTIATTSEAAITSEITTAPTTTVTDWTTFDLSEYYKYYNYNDDKTKVYKTLLEALIEKKEYTRRLNIQETSYNYLIENVDISDYEVLSDIEIQDAEIPYYFIDRCEIKVNVTRSDAPNFPVGERIWIFDYNEYAIDDLRDSEYVHTYISYFYQEKLDLRVKTAMYYSISFDCFETTNVNEYFNERVTLEEDIDCRGIVY
ncbi:MAG: hypothetical protein LBM41_06790, partial [Ruminococcus sp.]|nr:hypothetical protein [Ruminococcus sp.]